MKTLRIVALMLVVLGSVPSQASTITFDVTGVPGISGFVQYDSSAFHGFLEVVPNNAIVGLSINVLGYVFDLGDLFYFPGFSAAIIDTSVPRILNGFGLFAYDGSAGIAFYPDGFDGTPMDGDASLSFQRFGVSTTYPVKWVVATAPEPTTLLLLVLGTVVLEFSRRKRRSVRHWSPAWHALARTA